LGRRCRVSTQGGGEKRKAERGSMQSFHVTLQKCFFPSSATDTIMAEAALFKSKLYQTCTEAKWKPSNVKTSCGMLQ
jgi:hypothetical protein